MMTYGETHDRFKAAGFARFKEIEYCGGRTWKFEGLKFTEDSVAINAIVTYESDRTNVTNTDTNEIHEFIV